MLWNQGGKVTLVCDNKRTFLLEGQAHLRFHLRRCAWPHSSLQLAWVGQSKLAPQSRIHGL